MVQKRDVPGIKRYDAPAGGWGAGAHPPSRLRPRNFEIQGL
jgi:hypothetical protein